MVPVPQPAGQRQYRRSKIHRCTASGHELVPRLFRCPRSYKCPSVRSMPIKKQSNPQQQHVKLRIRCLASRRTCATEPLPGTPLSAPQKRIKRIKRIHTHFQNSTVKHSKAESTSTATTGRGDKAQHSFLTLVSCLVVTCDRALSLMPFLALGPLCASTSFIWTGVHTATIGVP